MHMIMRHCKRGCLDLVGHRKAGIQNPAARPPAFGLRLRPLAVASIAAVHPQGSSQSRFLLTWPPRFVFFDVRKADPAGPWGRCCRVCEQRPVVSGSSADRAQRRRSCSPASSLMLPGRIVAAHAHEFCGRSPGFALALVADRLGRGPLCPVPAIILRLNRRPLLITRHQRRQPIGFFRRRFHAVAGNSIAARKRAMPAADRRAAASSTPAACPRSRGSGTRNAWNGNVSEHCGS